MVYTVTEDSGLVTICTVLGGLFEIEVVVDLTTVDNSALGKNQWSGICNKWVIYIKHQRSGTIM